MKQLTSWTRVTLLAGLAMFLCHAPAAYAQITDVNSARINYILQCQGCHRADGSGSSKATPSLLTDGELFLSSPKGREFFVLVPGVAHAPLNDAELTDVINFVIKNLIMKDGGFESLFYTVPEVSKYRQVKTAKDITTLRREVIESLK